MLVLNPANKWYIYIYTWYTLQGERTLKRSRTIRLRGFYSCSLSGPPSLGEISPFSLMPHCGGATKREDWDGGTLGSWELIPRMVDRLYSRLYVISGISRVTPLLGLKPTWAGWTTMQICFRGRLSLEIRTQRMSALPKSVLLTIILHWHMRLVDCRTWLAVIDQDTLW